VASTTTSSWLIGVGPPDRSGNHPAFCQPEFATQSTGVASRGRTRSALGSSGFDTSEEREGRSGATDKGPIRCRPLEVDVAAARAWLFPPVVFERAQGSPLRGASTVHLWTSNLSRCLSRYPSDVFLRWRASEFGGRQVLDNHQVSCPLGVMLNQGVCGGPLSQRALSSGTMAGCRVPRVSNGNVYDQPPLKSQTRNKGDCHDESDDLTWRCCLVIHACRPGLGAACHQQSGLVRPVLSECKLPELRPR